VSGARVARAALRRGREVRNVVREPGERRERFRPVEVSPHRGHAERAQQRKAPRIPGERVHAPPSREQWNHALGDIAKADDEQAPHVRILA